MGENAKLSFSYFKGAPANVKYVSVASNQRLALS